MSKRSTIAEAASESSHKLRDHRPSLQNTFTKLVLSRQHTPLDHTLKVPLQSSNTHQGRREDAGLTAEQVLQNMKAHRGDNSHDGSSAKEMREFTASDFSSMYAANRKGGPMSMNTFSPSKREVANRSKFTSAIGKISG